MNGGQLELSQTSCNRAAQYTSPHKRHQLTRPSYISSESLTKSLPSFLLTLSSHTAGTHKSTLYSRNGRYCVFFRQWGVSSCVLQGLQWGCSFPHVPVWHLHCAWRKHSRSARADSLLKCMNFDSGTYIKAPTLHISTPNPPGSLARNNEA